MQNEDLINKVLDWRDKQMPEDSPKKQMWVDSDEDEIDREIREEMEKEKLK